MQWPTIKSRLKSLKSSYEIKYIIPKGERKSLRIYISTFLVLIWVFEIVTVNGDTFHGRQYRIYALG